MKILPLTTFKSAKNYTNKRKNASLVSFGVKVDPVNEALKDQKTGQVNKAVDNLIKGVFFAQKVFKGRYQVYLGRGDEDLIDFINLLKNSKGEFLKENIKCATKLLALSLFSKQKWKTVDFYDINLILNFAKKQDGELDKEIFNKVFEHTKKVETYSLASRNLAPLCSCSIKEKKKLLEIFSCSTFDENPASNFYNFSRFCTDENWNLIPENVEFVKKISKLPKANYSSCYFDLAKKYPSEREYLLELAKNPNFKTDINFERDFIFYMQDKYGRISDEDKQRLLSFLEKSYNLDEFSILFSRCCIYKNKKRVGFNDELFNQVSNLAPILNKREFSSLNSGILADLIENSVDIQKLSFIEKNDLLQNIKKLQVIQNDSALFSNIAKKLQNSIMSNIQPLDVSEESKLGFIKNILASKTASFTSFEEKLVSIIPRLENMEKGFELEYSRYEFMADLAKVCKDEFKKYCEKLNIEPVGHKSYNGLIQLQNLNQDNSKDKEVYDLAHKFMYENSFKTGDGELDYYLNILIKAMPEFINVVDKKQHASQNHTLDIHILLTLAYALKNPNYFEKLNQKDRAILKFAILFHDISKQEGIVDSTHPQVSASWVKGFSSKIFKTPDMQNRVFEFVNNHHWTKEFNVANKTKKLIDSLAFKFRRPNDFEMAKIMAQADMKAVSLAIYEAYGSCLNDDGISKIQDSINFYNSNGSFVNSHVIVNPKKLQNHIVEYNCKKFPLINLAQLDEEANVDEFGFGYGLKKKDLRFLVHMIGNKNIAEDLNTVKLLENPINGGVLSQSLIELNNKTTYSARKYGFLLSGSNHDIIAMSRIAIGSGLKKDFDRLLYLVFNSMSEVDKGDFRDRFIKNLGKEYKNITNSAYSNFYRKYLSNLTTLSQINPKEMYEIGKYKISGETLVQTLKNTLDEYVLFNGESANEIITYMPNINALVTKAQTLDEVPVELIDFAAENNLPVILI